jgi:hypothetical protein
MSPIAASIAHRLKTRDKVRRASGAISLIAAKTIGDTIAARARPPMKTPDQAMTGHAERSADR